MARLSSRQGQRSGAFHILAAILGGLGLLFALSHFAKINVMHYVANLSQYLFTPTFLGIFLVLLLLAAVPSIMRSSFAKRQRRDLARSMSSEESIASSAAAAAADHSASAGAADRSLSEFVPLPNVDIRRSIEKLTSGRKPDIIKLVDFIIFQGAARHASDIHMEPSEGESQIKYRVDGVLNHVASMRHDLHRRLVSRLKVMSKLSIYDRDKPQDGRLETRVGGRNFEVRISFMPTLHDEKVVIRLFESGEDQFDLRNLGFSPVHLRDIRRLSLLPQGTIYLTGPTGQGKTTTIYSCLRYIQEARQGSVNIMTIEDPIEHNINGVNQSQVNRARGLDFATGLRTVLRQDPNVIMVGEIRDLETAQIATRAGLTGHLVFTTVHADSSAGVFTRLIEMGIEPFLVASSSSAVLAQRLVRRICASCRQKTIPSPETLQLAGLSLDQPMDFFEGRGCPMCLGRGYQGRVGIYEILVVNDAIREVLVQKVPTRELYRAAVESGMATLLHDGLDKVNRGITTIDEIVRVVSI